MTDATRRNAMPGDSRVQSSNKKFVMTPLAAAVVVALNPTGPVQAQESDDGALDEVVVTATKRSLNLQDVAQSIDVLSGDDLVKMGAKDLEATIRALPSVTLTAMMPGQNSLVVRGISTGPFEYRTEAQVAVYLDEQPMTFNSQQVGIRNIDMARVEQLPGPQGTLFGSSSQTGTIRYITNKPNSNGFEGMVEGRYGVTKGGDPSSDMSLVLNMPMGDSFAMRAVGYRSHDGGYVDNVFGTSFSGNYDNSDQVAENINEYDVNGGRLHALWNMGDKWSALFTVVGENTDAVGVWDTDEALGDYKVTRFEDEWRTDDWVSTALTLDGDLGFADLSLNVTKFDRDIAYEYDNMTYSQWKDYTNRGYDYDSGYYYGYPLYNTNYNRSIIFNDQRQERESFELRLTSSGDSKLQWMVGAYYEDIIDEWYYGARVDDFLNTDSWYSANYYYAYYANYYGHYNYDCYCYMTNPNVSYPLAPTDVGYSNTLDRSIKQTAVFGEVNYDLTDELTFTAGMRWAEYDRDIYSRFAFPEGLPPYTDLILGADGSFSDVGKVDDTLFKVGLKYSLDDSRMVYGLYSQGFRLGGFNNQRAASTGRLPLEYTADYLDNYEFGIKSKWLNDRLLFNADVFYMEWTDYQQGADLGQWWMRGTVNAGDAETTGVEVQTEWQATDNLSLSLNFFVAKAEFSSNFCNEYIDNVHQPCVINSSGEAVWSSLDDDGEEIQANIVSGMRMPNSPNATAFASIYYTVPDVLGGDLWFYYDISYSDEIWNEIDSVRDNDRDGLAPSWTYSSFSAGLQFESGLDVELNVRNLTDEKSFSYVGTWEASNASDFGDPRYQKIRAQDRPRSIWLTLRYRFGET